MADEAIIKIPSGEVLEDDEAPGPTISLPDSGDAGEGGKLSMIVQLVKKCLGVKDIAAMRLSLPASLLEPLPNLEYWHYLDRPDLFAAINDSNDPFERILAVVRFIFTKDLKFVHGKVCKPYNSVLGEHFRGHWDVPPVSYSSDPTQPPILRVHTTIPPPPAQGSETVSVKSNRSGKSSKSTRSALSLTSTSKDKTSPTLSTAPTSLSCDAGLSKLSLSPINGSGSGRNDKDKDKDRGGDHIRVVYVTEQVSHHPPVSAYYASCPLRGVEMAGIDQISAKVSGTTVRVAPGSFNKGIYINLTSGPGMGEKYHITHPVANVNGILRGSFYITVGDSTIVTCMGAKGVAYRAVIEYKEESWLGRAHFLVEGVIHTYDEGSTEHEEWTKVKHVPTARVVAVFDGCWRNHIRWRRTAASPPAPSTSLSTTSSPTPSFSAPSLSETEYATLVDLSTLFVVPKKVRPLERQLPNESRKLWDAVTTRLLAKEYGEATKAKLAIEQKQRDEAGERKKKGAQFIPQYFEQDISSGVPVLTAAGRKAVEEELKECSDNWPSSS
ncbi:hypothetical protein CY34DRAFT_484105 [Suillus luteus UH-Slu-Lm8-n1]|uniref:Unplaced genomic scaffold CY34scaffold_352, whole genome shotgun sequence n=1 Tax=Suillus luteus UH-Slu-Lm8-n1 TaxID=930992 RepID=A0A0C9ZHW1_9AGAM|nr:hypothetical protein CY34DRAFT_484105 [Suillus luteus UH-Slu-Lm8-n1]